jgi:hypothetical protein
MNRVIGASEFWLSPIAIRLSASNLCCFHQKMVIGRTLAAETHSLSFVLPDYTLFRYIAVGGRIVLP